MPEYPIYIADWVYSRCLFASLMVKCCMSLLSRKPCWCPLTIAKSGYLEKTTSWCEQILPSIIEFVWDAKKENIFLVPQLEKLVHSNSTPHQLWLLVYTSHEYSFFISTMNQRLHPYIIYNTTISTGAYIYIFSWSIYVYIYMYIFTMKPPLRIKYCKTIVKILLAY